MDALSFSPGSSHSSSLTPYSGDEVSVVIQPGQSYNRMNYGFWVTINERDPNAKDQVPPKKSGKTTTANERVVQGEDLENNVVPKEHAGGEGNANDGDVIAVDKEAFNLMNLHTGAAILAGLLGLGALFELVDAKIFQMFEGLLPGAGDWSFLQKNRAETPPNPKRKKLVYIGKIKQ